MPEPSNANFRYNKSSPEHNTSLAQSVLNVALVMVESFVTLLLRFDANLRQEAYPLATDNVVVCVRSYVPHVTFYATFTYNGVLFDSQLQPNQQVDVTINAFTWQLLGAIISNDAKSIDKLQMRGEPLRLEQVKRFLLGMGLGQIIKQLVQTVKGKAEKPEPPKKDDLIVDYKQRINEQQTQINTLTLSHTQLNAQTTELKSKNKILTIALGVMMVLFLASLVFLFTQH